MSKICQEDSLQESNSMKDETKKLSLNLFKLFEAVILHAMHGKRTVANSSSHPNTKSAKKN